MTRAAHQDHPCAVCGATPAMYGFGQMVVRRVSVQGQGAVGPAPVPLVWGCGEHRGEVETLYWEQIGGRKIQQIIPRIIPESVPENARAHAAPVQLGFAL